MNTLYLSSIIVTLYLSSYYCSSFSHRCARTQKCVRPKSQICVRETRSGELGTVLPPYAHAFCTRLFLVQKIYQTFASPGTKFWYKLCFTYQTLWYKFFSGTIFLVQFLFLVQKRSGSRSASGARFAFGQRVRPFPICVRAHLWPHVPRNTTQCDGTHGSHIDHEGRLEIFSVSCTTQRATARNPL